MSKEIFITKTVTCKNAVHVDKTFWNFLIDIQTLTYIIPLALSQRIDKSILALGYMLMPRFK